MMARGANPDGISRPSPDYGTTETFAAKAFDLLSTINGYPEHFSIFQGEKLVIRLASKPKGLIPLPRLLLRALWRNSLASAIRLRSVRKKARRSRDERRKPVAQVERIVVRNIVTGTVLFRRKSDGSIPIFAEMPAGYRDGGADYTCRIDLDTAEWPFGVYECIVHDDRGNASQDIFVNIKPRSLEHTDLLCVLPSFTWQAYNRTGGGSFYSHELGYLRTVSPKRPMHHDSDNSIAPALALLSLFEEHKLRVACIDSWDLHRQTCPDGAIPIMAILVHDEYWSTPMRAHVDHLLDRGTALLVLSGNTCWWHVEVQNGNISVDKTPPRTALWHRQQRPEEETFISSFRFGGYPIEPSLRKTHFAPLVAKISRVQMRKAGGLKVTDPAHPLFSGIALRDDVSFGEKVPIVYREVDGVPLDPKGCIDRSQYQAPDIAPHVIATALTLYGGDIHRAGVIAEGRVRNGYVLHMGSIGWARGVWRKNKDVRRVVMNAYRHCRAMAEGRRSAAADKPAGA